MQAKGSFWGHKKKGDTGDLQRNRRHPASLLRCALNLTVKVLRRNRLPALATIILYEKTTDISSKFLLISGREESPCHDLFSPL
jgi:hypothetical protein